MNNQNVFTNVADLAIPFGLLFALKAFKKTHDNTNKKKATVPKKKKKGGACSACALQQYGGTKEMIQHELSKITEDLRNILNM